MTKTLKAKGTEYTVTADAAQTPDGRPGFRITCSCATHAGHGNAAIVAYDIAPKNIHGTVVMANVPSSMMRKANERKGIWAA